MVIRISRREVLNNLIRLKDNLSELQEEEKEGRHGKEERDQKKGKRSYKALLNQKTGDLRFAKKISALEQRLSPKKGAKESLSDWKEIHLLVEEGKDSKIHFEILDESDRALHPHELSQLAWRIVSETLSVLNTKGKEIEETKDLLPEQNALQDLSSIRLAQDSIRIEELPGWKDSLDRQAAEKLLTGHPEGTYLLREGDEITLSISFHISEEQHSFVHPYLLTFVDQGKKISEILLLHTDKGWTFYSDDPDLKQPFYHYFPSVKELLFHLKQFARNPI